MNVFRYEYVVLDVFTDTPLQGNPVAVFTDAASLNEEQMQRAARELNLSETVFVTERTNNSARIRIFTPSAELPFAGHPVLGTAATLGDSGTVVLETELRSVAVRLSDGGCYAEMEHGLPAPERFERQDELLQALHATGSLLPIEAYRNGPLHVYVALDTAEEVANLKPDLNALQALGPLGVNCFTQTGPRTVKTRMFSPGLGVNEDPATGSAAGPLALHMRRHGQLAEGEQLEIHQGEEIARPSTLYARVEDNTIRVGGSAIQVARGTYLIP